MRQRSSVLLEHDQEKRPAQPSVWTGYYPDWRDVPVRSRGVDRHRIPELILLSLPRQWPWALARSTIDVVNSRPLMPEGPNIPPTWATGAAPFPKTVDPNAALRSADDVAAVLQSRLRICGVLLFPLGVVLAAVGI